MATPEQKLAEAQTAVALLERSAPRFPDPRLRRELRLARARLDRAARDVRGTAPRAPRLAEVVDAAHAGVAARRRLRGLERRAVSAADPEALARVHAALQVVGMAPLLKLAPTLAEVLRALRPSCERHRTLAKLRTLERRAIASGDPEARTWTAAALRRMGETPL